MLDGSTTHTHTHNRQNRCKTKSVWRTKNKNHLDPRPSSQTGISLFPSVAFTTPYPIFFFLFQNIILTTNTPPLHYKGWTYQHTNQRYKVHEMLTYDADAASYHHHLASFRLSNQTQELKRTKNSRRQTLRTDVQKYPPHHQHHSHCFYIATPLSLSIPSGGSPKALNR